MCNSVLPPCMNVHRAYAWCLQRSDCAELQRQLCATLWDAESPKGPGSLQKQVLLTIEPTLQPHIAHL